MWSFCFVPFQVTLVIITSYYHSFWNFDSFIKTNPVLLFKVHSLFEFLLFQSFATICNFPKLFAFQWVYSALLLVLNCNSIFLLVACLLPQGMTSTCLNVVQIAQLKSVVIRWKAFTNSLFLMETAIFLTCIDHVFYCSCLLTNLFILVVPQVLRGLAEVVARCRSWIKYVNRRKIQISSSVTEIF